VLTEDARTPIKGRVEVRSVKGNEEQKVPGDKIID